MAMPQNPPPGFVFTPRMHKTLTFIRDFHAANGRAPCMSEIAEGTGMIGNNCSVHMARMLDIGLVIRRAATSSRNRPMWHYSLSARGKEWL